MGFAPTVGHGFTNRNIFREFYNWTMNFRRDSDIVDSYGPFVARSGEASPTESYAYSSKPKGHLKTT